MALLLLVGPVYAAKPAVATGSLTVGEITITSHRADGDNTFYDVNAALTLTGGIQGAGTAMEELVLHNSTGRIEFHILTPFIGTVMGSQTGSMIMHIEATATSIVTATNIQLTSVEGTIVLTDGSGGLTGIHGQGTFTLTTEQDSYTVRVHFTQA